MRVTEYAYSLSRLQRFQILCQPSYAVVRFVSSGRLAARYRQHDVVHISEIEGIPYRAVVFFKGVLSIHLVYVVVVSESVSDRYSCRFGAQSLVVLLQSALSADISGVYQKVGIFPIYGIGYKVEPILRRGVTDEYLRIAYMQIRRALAALVNINGEIVFVNAAFNSLVPVVVPSGKRLHEYHAFSLPARQEIAAVLVGYRYVSAVADRQPRNRESFIIIYMAAIHSPTSV